MYKARKPNTNTNTKNHSKVIPLLVMFVIVLVVICGAIWWFFIRETPDPTKDWQPKYDTPTSNQTTQTDAKSAQNADDYKNTAETPVAQTSQEVSKATTGSIAIDDLAQANGYINAKASTNSFDVKKCVYQFTSPNAKPVIRELNGDCAGISIPEVEFEYIGKYSLLVTAYSDSEKININKGITIR